MAASDTAQGNGLGTLAACANRTLILTGTLLGGYASDVYNLLFRLEAGKMVAHGYEWGEAGLRSFSEAYGVLEKVTTIEPADNSCSKARVTKLIKRRPGASPLLFGEFLMSLAAFVSLEDISAERDGGYYVAGTRIGLDVIVHEFESGKSPEAILQSHSSIGSLAKVYGVITFILAGVYCDPFQTKS